MSRRRIGEELKLKLADSCCAESPVLLRSRTRSLFLLVGKRADDQLWRPTGRRSMRGVRFARVVISTWLAS